MCIVFSSANKNLCIFLKTKFQNAHYGGKFQFQGNYKVTL